MRQYIGVVLVKSDGSVLAQHRDNKPTILGPNTWCVVGGARDVGDVDLKSVGARELKEETEYEIKPEELRFLARDEYTTEKGTLIQRVILWAPYDNHQEIRCNEGQEIRFVDPMEFSELNFYTGHEHFLRKASEKVFGDGIENR